MTLTTATNNLPGGSDAHSSFEDKKVNITLTLDRVCVEKFSMFKKCSTSAVVYWSLSQKKVRRALRFTYRHSLQ